MSSVIHLATSRIIKAGAVDGKSNVSDSKAQAAGALAPNPYESSYDVPGSGARTVDLPRIEDVQVGRDARPSQSPHQLLISERTPSRGKRDRAANAILRQLEHGQTFAFATESNMPGSFLGTLIQSAKRDGVLQHPVEARVGSKGPKIQLQERLLAAIWSSNVSPHDRPELLLELDADVVAAYHERLPTHLLAEELTTTLSRAASNVNGVRGFHRTASKPERQAILGFIAEHEPLDFWTTRALEKYVRTWVGSRSRPHLRAAIRDASESP